MMKYLFFPLIYLLSFSTIGQKANDVALKTNFHYLRYPEKSGISTKEFAMSVSEEYACDGAVPAKTYTTPISTDPRGKFYLAMVPTERLFFSQAKDLYGNMMTKKLDFTDITIHTSDIQLKNQSVDSKDNLKIANQKLYFLSFDVNVPAEISIHRRGSVDELVMEANSSQVGLKRLTFPSNVIFSAEMSDVQREGFTSQTALMNAWNKYKKYCTNQWRDKLIAEFLTPVYSEYKERFMLYEIWDQAKIFSDKNKDGGYEHIVSAAENYIAVFASIENDYKNGKHTKQWTKEYQEHLNTSIKTWETFLAETNFDVTKSDKLISNDYRQNILLNYVEGLIFTGQFDKATVLIDEQLKSKLKSGTVTDLNRLQRILLFEKTQFDGGATEKGWVRLG